ncbi:XkdF-like putative serine protease domain-containing protein [Methanobrevibacter smithii]|mgnify:CR=1 FL=1|uniref:XkdF-like putative serine protease domain-containing protein n=1 Tax=Methanobrevibacter smithii TaxID=2173 RepID=UPI00384CAC05
MRVKEKTDAIYVRGVVIPCGMADNTGDAPQSKEDIKKIFTNYLTHETDVQHSWVKNFNVYNLENTITETETEINGQKVPAHSWIASTMVVNPEIQAMIREGKLNGYSLGAVGEDGLNENVNFLNKSLRYDELKDKEDLNPIFISLVDKPANGFKWEVYDYNSFLAKSGDIMTNEMSIPSNEEGMVSEGFVERIINKFFLAKSEEEAKKEDEKAASSKKEDELEKSVDEPDISNKELLEKLPELVATAVIEGMKKLAEESSKKDDNAEEKKLEKNEESTSSSKKEDELEKSDEEDEKDKLEKSLGNRKAGPKNTLTKSTSKIPANNTYRTSTFLNSETRDRFGRNKKFL